MKKLPVILLLALTVTLGAKAQTNATPSVKLETVYGNVLSFEPSKKIAVRTTDGKQREFLIEKSTVFRDSNGKTSKEFSRPKDGWLNITASNSPEGWKAFIIDSRVQDVGPPDYVPKPEPISTNPPTKGDSHAKPAVNSDIKN